MDITFKHIHDGTGAYLRTKITCHDCKTSITVEKKTDDLDRVLLEMMHEPMCLGDLSLIEKEVIGEPVN